MKTLFWVGSVGALAFALSVVGCGGGDGMTGNPGTGGSGTGGSGSGGSGSGGSGTGSCGVSPCGGDLVGNWSFTDACIDAEALADAAFGAECPDATITGLNVTYTGTIGFTAANNYSVDATTSMSYTLTIPVSCLEPATCADLAASGQATCSGTTTCVCMFSGTSNTTESGTYTLSGNVLTTTPSGETADGPISYCVQGSTVHFMEMSAGRTVSELVAQRQ